MELCMPVTCSPVDALRSLIGGTVTFLSLECFFMSQTVFLLEDEQAIYSGYDKSIYLVVVLFHIWVCKIWKGI